MKLHFKKIGKGPVIVILHGLFGMSDNWMTIAKTLASDYCFYLLDLRNHGRTSHSMEFTYQLMANDVAEFLEDHRLKDIILIGHSMGGKSAMSFASSHSELLNKLVIVDIANKNYKTSYFEKYIDVMLSFDLKEIKSRKEAETLFMEKCTVYPGTLQFLLKNLYRDEKNIFFWRLNLNSLKKNLPNILSKVNIPNPVVTQTLFMKGAKSDYISDEDAGDLQKQFVNSQIVEIDGATHWVHSTAPHNFYEALTAFIND